MAKYTTYHCTGCGNEVTPSQTAWFTTEPFITCRQCGSRIHVSIAFIASKWSLSFFVFGYVPCWLGVVALAPWEEPMPLFGKLFVAFFVGGFVTLIPTFIGWVVGIFVGRKIGAKSV
jgi:DNA-directed RNA polymerase subunit RPC12/RpoP